MRTQQQPTAPRKRAAVHIAQPGRTARALCGQISSNPKAFEDAGREATCPACVAIDGSWCPQCGMEIKNGRSYCTECRSQIQR